MSDEKDIANGFNQYYVNVGPQLADRIQTPQNKCFRDYLYNPSMHEFKFHEISSNMIIITIDSLKPKTSCGIDGASNQLLKYLKNETSVNLIQCIKDL